MKNLLLYVNFFFLILSSAAWAEIRETARMKEALAGARAGDVVVLDIDNTILETPQALGSDQWVDYLIGKYKAQGLEPKAALDRALVDWDRVQRATRMQLVEAETPNLVRAVRRKGVTILALTARPANLADVSVGQLRANDVTFPTYDGFRGEGVVYHGGVLFADGKNKGHVLRDFLRQLNIQPARILFVDDKAKNVKNMDAEFANDGFPNINYRYGAADPKVRAFSKEVAELQWTYFDRFGQLISDEAAEEILEDM